MTKIAAAVILVAVIWVLGAQIHSFLGRQRELNGEFAEVGSKLKKAKIDSEKFQANFDYYSNPANLEKELRARFNYKQPGEKLIIIVPRATSGVSSTDNE